MSTRTIVLNMQDQGIKYVKKVSVSKKEDYAKVRTVHKK